MSNEKKGKANPNTYRANFISIIKGTGDTINPSRNKCKSELITPKTIICYESIYNEYQGASLKTITDEHNVSPRTVKNYYNIYKELRDTDALTEDEIEVYLNNNGESYPLEPLPELPPENKLLLILEQQESILKELQSLNQRQEPPLELQEEITKLKEEISKLQDIIHQQQETIYKQQEAFLLVTNENEALKQAALKDKEQLNNQTKDNSLTVDRQLTDIYQTVKRIEEQTNKNDKRMGIIKEVLTSLVKITGDNRVTNTMTTPVQLNTSPSKTDENDEKIYTVPSKTLFKLYNLAFQAKGRVEICNGDYINSKKALASIYEELASILDEAGDDFNIYKEIYIQNDMANKVFNHIFENGAIFKKHYEEIPAELSNTYTKINRILKELEKYQKKPKQS